MCVLVGGGGGGGDGKGGSGGRGEGAFPLGLLQCGGTVLCATSAWKVFKSTCNIYKKKRKEQIRVLCCSFYALLGEATPPHPHPFFKMNILKNYHISASYPELICLRGKHAKSAFSSQVIWYGIQTDQTKSNCAFAYMWECLNTIRINWSRTVLNKKCINQVNVLIKLKINKNNCQMSMRLMHTHTQKGRSVTDLLLLSITNHLHFFLLITSLAVC